MAPQRIAGILLTASGAVAVAALAIEALAIAPAWQVVTSPPAEAIDAVAGVREAYQVTVALWALCGLIAIGGTAALGAVLLPARPDDPGCRPVAAASTAVLVAGETLWVVALIIQGTTLLMTQAQGGAATDLAYLVLTEIGHVLWLVSFAAIARGLAGLGFALRRVRVVRAAAPWIAWAGAIAIAVLVAVLHDVPPFVFFLLVLPAIGVTAVLSSARSPARGSE